MKLGLFIGLGRGSSAAGVSVTTITAPSFNSALLIVGNALTTAYVAGSYTSTGGAVTEGTITWLVDGNPVAGSYVLSPGDIVVNATPILLIGGLDLGFTATTGNVVVTNSPPVATNQSGTGTIAAGTGAAPDAMAAPTVTTTATRATITKASDPFNGGSAITDYDYRYSIDNGGSFSAWAAMTSPQVVTGLTPGASGFIAQTRANNVIGKGATGASSTAATMKVVTFLGQVVLGATTTTLTGDLTTLLTTTGGTGGPLLQDDVVLLAWGRSTSAADATMTISSSGWTKTHDLFQTDTRCANLGFGWKAMGPTPDTSVVTDGPGATTDGGCLIALAWRYVNPTTPFDVTTVTVTAGDTALGDPGAITPTSVGAVIGTIVGSTGDITPAALNAPSGMTGCGAVVSGGSSRGFRIGTARIGWTSGAYDPAAVTSSESGTTDSTAAITYALKPY